MTALDLRQALRLSVQAERAKAPTDTEAKAAATAAGKVYGALSDAASTVLTSAAPFSAAELAPRHVTRDELLVAAYWARRAAAAIVAALDEYEATL